jgi:hypothetical protein
MCLPPSGGRHNEVGNPRGAGNPPSAALGLTERVSQSFSRQGPMVRSGIFFRSKAKGLAARPRLEGGKPQRGKSQGGIGLRPGTISGARRHGSLTGGKLRGRAGSIPTWPRSGGMFRQRRGSNGSERSAARQGE